MSEVKADRGPKKRIVGRRLTVPYTREESNIFDRMLRPRLTVKMYSDFLSDWITVDDVLADTGADVSVLPRSLGVLLVGNIRKGRRFRITGLAGYTKYIYLHYLMIKIGRKKIKAAVAIAATDDFPPTLGRMEAMDKMNIEYQKGRRMVISW